MLNAQFITAGKATFTVDNGKGEHYTYRVEAKEASGSYPAAHFVKLLTGPDNNADYTYIGKLQAQDLTFHLTPKSKATDDAKSIKVLRWALHMIKASKQLPEGYRIQHEGRCGRCNRVLTHPESIESGIGPECSKAIGA